MKFIVLVWTKDESHKIVNDNNPYGNFTREEAEKEAAYWRRCGFGAALQKSHYQYQPGAGKEPLPALL